jgi:Ser/Thr protein kinase RdoA (MazF antagonist)
MPSSQFVNSHNVFHVVEAFCGSQRPIRVHPLDRDSEGFSGAIVLRVVVQHSKYAVDVEYCLRGWPPESLPRERLLGLHRLLEHIHRCGVTQVAVPLRSQFGSTMHAEAGQFWQLEPWLPGQADFWSNPSDQRLQNAMTVLAQWHEAASRFDARDSESEWFGQHASETSPTVLDRLQRIQRFRSEDVAQLRNSVAGESSLQPWGATKLAELRHLARRILDLFELSVSRVADDLLMHRGMHFRLHPCLRDVWHDHVLFEGDQVSGLIDPSAAKSETPATDVARLLGSFLADADDRWDTAIAAYRSVRPLSDREASLARVLDQSTVLLSGLTWLERIFVHRLHYSNPSRVLSRLRRITSRLEHLATSTLTKTKQRS